MSIAHPSGVASHPALSIRRYGLFKRALDLIVGGTIFLFAMPVIALGWLAVRLTSRGPGFYSQTRLGRFGKPYRIYKLRSMYHNCEIVSGVRWSVQGDDRITPVGKWIRKLHIDELPQLWNVLAGDMSLVGPRPERPEFVGPLQARVPGYANRMMVRPGLTGFAQIQLPPDSGLESVKKKLVFDLHYVQHKKFSLDVRILFGTAIYLLGPSYDTIRKIAALPNLRSKFAMSSEVIPFVKNEPPTADAFASEAPAA